jgi:hypothetical protein
MSTSTPHPAAAVWGAAHPFRMALTALRVGLATVMVAATFAQLATYEVYWRHIGLHDLALRTGNFFSAFTFEVNLLGAVILVAGAWLLWRGHGAEPLWFTRVRLCLLAAIVIVGVVYNVLLRGAPTGPGEQLDWANTVVHDVAPVGIAIDWLIAPHWQRLALRSAGLVVLFPIGWLTYTLIRATLVRDELLGTPYYYPYGFLNPYGQGGWGAVLVMIGELLVFTVAIGLAAVLAVRVEDRVTRAVRLRAA